MENKHKTERVSDNLNDRATKNKCRLLRSIYDPRIRYSWVSLFLVCMLLLILVLLNLAVGILEKKNAWRVDCSFNAMTTQSAQTLEVLDALENPVHIYALYARGEEDGPLLELLNRYAAASPLVTWEQLDVSLNPGLLSKFRSGTSDQSLTNDSVVVACETTGRWKILSALDFISLSYNYDQGIYTYTGLTYESSLTNAIRYVSQGEIPRIMILQGHGELDENGTADFAQLLSDNSYDVCYFTLNTTETTLQSDDILMILSPIRDLTDDEMGKISAFAEDGGCMLLTCDYTDPLDTMPNYASLLRSYGVQAENGIVVAPAEQNSYYYNGNRTWIVPVMQSTDMTQDLVESLDTFLILAGSRGFAMPEEGDRSLTTEAVLTSTANAYLRDFSDGEYTIEKQSNDRTGPFALALQAKRMMNSGSISRVFVLGASTLLTSKDEYTFTVSQDFIIRVIRFLAGTRQTGVNITAKAAVRPALSTNSISLGSFVIIFLPAMVLVLGALVLIRRRNS